MTAIRGVYLLGGNLAFSARLKGPLIAAENQAVATAGTWHGIGVMQYQRPSKLFMLEQMPGYKKVLKHRNAGLEKTTLIIAK